VDTPGREGLTGTAPASLYQPTIETEQITLAPDWRPAEQQPAWRRDFPIDWPQDHYVARRDFMKFMVLTSLAFTVGQFWIALQNWLRKARGMPVIKRIGSLAEVPVGGVLMFTYPGEQDACILIRPERDIMFAYSQECTHLACAVIHRLDKSVIHCPCHEGYFDLRSGRPVAGPPRRPLPRIQLDVRGDNIYAAGVEWRTV
jgi:Rieske Fe-S protein